jgi:antitoxin component YwqK of YwqJK toxin-antitoxin module
VVGEAARLTRALGLLACVGLAPVAAAAGSNDLPAWVINASCRDGAPQGPYQLRTPDGRLRVAGAFNNGKRTGSFIFWSNDGVRVAHVPYDEDERNGTVATWYPGRPGAEPARRLESAWRRGRREGLTRSWYADGRRRAETEYAGGALVTTTGWSDTGTQLGDEAARALAQRDAEAADAEYAELDRLVREHLPRCD